MSKSIWKDGNFAKMLVRMEQINKLEVQVGVVTPQLHYRKGRVPKSMADVYLWHEFGTSDGHVPPRPTLRPTFGEYQGLLSTVLANNLMHSVVKGGNYKKPLYDIGGTFSKLVKNAILKLQHPALSPYTIKTRVNKGTTNPLVDTGQLMSSISYKVTYG